MKNIIFYLLLLVSPVSWSQKNVTVAPLSSVVVAATASAAAQVIALRHATVSSEITAPVVAVLADVGQRVRVGDLLLEMDKTDFELALEQAEASLAATTARLELARQRLSDAQTLSGKQFVSADDLRLRQTELAVQVADQRNLTATVALARRQLDKTVVLAPFDGYITSRTAHPGELMVPGSPLLTVTSDTAVEVEGRIFVADIEGLRQADQPVFETGQGQYPLHLLRLAEVLEPTARVATARFAFTGEHAMAGQSGVVRWQAATGRIPPGLVVSRDDQLGVFVAAAGTARFVPLPAAQEGRPANHSLPLDTQVIVRGHTLLNDGDALAVQQ